MSDQRIAQDKRPRINGHPVPHEPSFPNISANSKAGELIITAGLTSNPPGWKWPMTNSTTENRSNHRFKLRRSDISGQCPEYAAPDGAGTLFCRGSTKISHLTALANGKEKFMGCPKPPARNALWHRPTRPGGRTQPPRFRPAARDYGGDGERGGTAERLHPPRGAEGQILQNQRSQRPLAALILKWLGNGHGARSIMRLPPFSSLGEAEDSSPRRQPWVSG